MATAHPFSNAGLGQFGKDISYAGGSGNPSSSSSKEGEPTFLGTLLATAAQKTGLVDWLNPPKKNNVSQASIPPITPVANIGVMPPSVTEPINNEVITTPIPNPNAYHVDTLKMWEEN